MQMWKHASLSCCLWISSVLIGFSQVQSSYPQHLFASPLHIPLLLAGNYGELRPDHFHAGLDIKTQGRIGLPVYASADGYISRVTISNSGYGHAIYIQHPEGYTTVYGHLERFMPALAAYVKEQQYLQQSWAIDLKLRPNQFPVKQGQLIAWSGNTGSVAGPHLHFEIRNTSTQTPLNTLLFGFPVKDHIPPTIYRIAIYDRDQSIYLQRPLEVPVHLINGHWTTQPSELLVNSRHIGLGIEVLDHEDHTSNVFGIYEARLYDDGYQVASFKLDSISFSDMLYVNAHMDYATWRREGRQYQLFFPLSGNHLPIYSLSTSRGMIDLSDGRPHHLSIEVKDAYGNTRVVRFLVKLAPGIKAIREAPDSCVLPMIPGVRNIVDEPNLSFYLDPDALYDRICFHMEVENSPDPQLLSPIYRLEPADIPLQTPFTLYLKPHPDIPQPLHQKLVIIQHNARQETVAPAIWASGGWLKADFRSFGSFFVEADTVAPRIEPLTRLYPGIRLTQAREIRFRITDNLSGIADYRAELDGKWLLMGQFKNTIYYIFDEHCGPGKHTLTLTVRDRVNNISTYTLNFIR
ncbi:MAG: peptidoglycan DD-metalloendopeptidase family protein [Thermoflavifilum sp.]|nr:peptidoglycan DD-metalloendopeptidase family protein [Thermoflavifilum sp.]